MKSQSSSRFAYLIQSSYNWQQMAIEHQTIVAFNFYIHFSFSVPVSHSVSNRIFFGHKTKKTKGKNVVCAETKVVVDGGENHFY